MRTSWVNMSGVVGSAIGVLLLSGLARADVLEQSESRARFGEKDFAYFFIEAEDFDDNNPRGDGEAWLLSSEPESKLVTVNEFDVDPDTGELAEPDPWEFASGDESITNALFQSTVTNESGGGHDVQYVVSFDTAGTYYLYIRQHSPLGPEFDRNKNDSFYAPVEFGENPRQLKVNGDDYGMLESMEFEGDVSRRGPWVWFAARSRVDNAEQNPLSEQREDTFQEYVITEDMVGEELILEFDHRENGTMLDAFLFIDVNSGLLPTDGNGEDGTGFRGEENEIDLEFGLRNLNFEPPEPPEPQGISLRPGDANNDGGVNISDPVAALNALFGGAPLPACYLTDGTLNDAGLQVLDWNGDGAHNIADPVSSLNNQFGGGAGHALGADCVQLESPCADVCQ